jgi:hypothetical protein
MESPDELYQGFPTYFISIYRLFELPGSGNGSG